MAFGQRRKTLRNSLRATFPEIGDRTHDFFTLRPERLSVEEFVELTLFVEKCINDR